MKNIKTFESDIQKSFSDWAKNPKKPEEKEFKKLNVVKKTVLEVDYSDFEQFVNSIYGGNLEIVAIQEMGNSSYVEQTVPSKYRYPDKKKEEQIRSGKYPMYSIGYIFDCLYEDGYLEEGTYLIKISW
jgi:hypothetical protein